MMNKWFTLAFVLLGTSMALAIPFKVFWNVPSQLCHKYGIYINASKWGILQNIDDQFYGDKMNIIYQAGLFPFFNDTTPVFGGIPQNGNLAYHLASFRKQVDQRIPNGFSGLAVLDFESYQPIYNEANWRYKRASIYWAERKYPNMPRIGQQIAAQVGFETSAQIFFQSLLQEGARLRPNAYWGYYHYPYCRNPKPGQPKCNPDQMSANEKMQWLYKSSGAYFPSIYIYKHGWSADNRRLQVASRLRQTLQLRKNNNDLKKPIVPYFWYKYHDDIETFITEEDLVNTIVSSKKVFGLDGIVIWGAGNDVNSKAKCQLLQTYLDTKLGPIIVKMNE